MNTKTILVAIALAVLFGAFHIQTASATVGGPITISEVVYNANGNNIYYTKHISGEFGCSPQTAWLDLNTGISQEYDSPCKNSNTGHAFDDYEARKEELYLFSEELPLINLAKNDIDISVQYIDTEYFEDVPTQKLHSNFTAQVTKGNVKQSISFTGCNENQENIFSGYAVPDSGSILLLISRTQDCFEGGYIGEDLYMIKNMTITDTSFAGTKDASPLKSSNHNISLMSGETTLETMELDSHSDSQLETEDINGDSSMENSENDSKELNIYHIVVSILLFVIALLIGYMLGKGKRQAV